jgi:hypothetical protein
MLGAIEPALTVRLLARRLGEAIIRRSRNDVREQGQERACDETEKNGARESCSSFRQNLDSGYALERRVFGDKLGRNEPQIRINSGPYFSREN